MRLQAKVAALLLAAGCVAPAPHSGIVTASLVHPDGSPARTRRDSCDDPHPRNPDGTLAHSWMMDGNGVWRCWWDEVLKR